MYKDRKKMGLVLNHPINGDSVTWWVLLLESLQRLEWCKVTEKIGGPRGGGGATSRKPRGRATFLRIPGARLARAQGSVATYSSV